MVVLSVCLPKHESGVSFSKTALEFEGVRHASVSVLSALAALEMFAHNCMLSAICGTVQYRTVQYSTVQYSTVQYSTEQNSTVQYRTVQYSTVQKVKLAK